MRLFDIFVVWHVENGLRSKEGKDSDLAKVIVVLTLP